MSDAHTLSQPDIIRASVAKKFRYSLKLLQGPTVNGARNPVPCGAGGRKLYLRIILIHEDQIINRRMNDTGTTRYRTMKL